MYLAVVGGGAWFAGALKALLSDDATLHAVESARDLRPPAPCEDGQARIAILASETGHDRLRTRLAELRRHDPKLRVVVRLRTLRPDLVRDAMQAGAWGCFAENDAPDILLNLLATVRSGRMSFPYVDFTELSDDPFERLTRREREVLAALSKGWTNTQISSRLGVSENTVKYHLKLIYEKLEVSNRSTAVAAYLRHVSL
ncbi:MAG: response regulator transcription factor [Pseudomonadota bacterium]